MTRPSNTSRCNGSSRNTPRNDYWTYKWVNEGTSHTQTFSCQQGKSGFIGNNGGMGQQGSYGKVTLVPRNEIPTEKISNAAPLSSLLGNTIELVQNIWVEKRGLLALLASGSDVSDTYTYLNNTVRLQYRVNWEAKTSPQELKVDTAKITARIDLNNNNPQVKFELPGTLEYRIVKDPQSLIEILTITGGFAPDRVKAFEIQSISGIDANNQLVLVDRGRVRPLLTDTKIEVIASSKESASGVTVTDGYQERYRYTYNLPPSGSLREGLTENDSVYTLNVGKHFDPWLKTGYRVRYDIIVTQTTKMGVVYTQEQSIEFVAQ